eukprot:9495951-Pyramimonas_sp.AAC.1
MESDWNTIGILRDLYRVLQDASPIGRRSWPRWRAVGFRTQECVGNSKGAHGVSEPHIDLRQRMTEVLHVAFPPTAPGGNNCN